MRPELPQLAYTLSPDGILVGVEIGYSIWSDSRDLEALMLAQQLGKGILQFVAGQSTQSFWLTAFDHVRASRVPHTFHYRCDGPDLKRNMRVVVSPKDGNELLLQHYVIATEPLPVHLRFQPGLSVDSVRCSICNDVRHGDVWRSPESAWSLGLLSSSSINLVTYDVCTDCNLQRHGEVLSQPVSRSHAGHRGS